MRLLLLAALIVFTVKAGAAPFLVSDPFTGSVTAGDTILCMVQNGSGSPTGTPIAVYGAQTGPGCKVDLAGFPGGVANLQVWYRSQLWGPGSDSAKIPFVLSVPVAGQAGPAAVRVAP
jgi:hypothetical protein